MPDQDCYFFVDMDVKVENEEDRPISCLCVECHDSHYPEAGWFYRGSEDGYGPWDYMCRMCGKLIHNFKEEHDEQE